MRALVLGLGLLPFVFFAGRDLSVHRKERRPTWGEEAIHLLLGAAQAGVVVQAFRGDLPRLLLGCVLVAIFGCVDEFLFHRDLPALESDLHAKAHFALFSFVALASALAAFPDLESLLRFARRGAP